jgi:hypothetical protein
MQHQGVYMRYRLEYWMGLEPGDNGKIRQSEPGWYECDDWLHMVDAWQATARILNDHGGAVLMDEARQELLSCIHTEASELLGNPATDTIKGAWAVPGQSPAETYWTLRRRAEAEYQARRQARRQRLPAPASPQPLKPEPRQPSEAETQAVTVLAGLGEAKRKCAGPVAEIAAQHPTLDCAGIIRAYYAKAAPIAAAAASSGP